MLEELSFYFFTIITLGFFLISVFSKNMLYALSSLAGGMVFLSSFYFLLDAEFLGVIQIIVYSGAVLGLYSFAMMFFDASKNLKEKLSSKFTISILIILSAILLLAIIQGFNPQGLNANLTLIDENIFDFNKQLGLAIFSKYLLAFEFIAILLLIALVCAIVLTHKELIKDKK
ncbi:MULTISPECIES: NADH-quinone oxidoreductase subunit J [unclassified Campylobacter]|uniref:NADH-quinone oxidoreductase subunit J n=1 Tax=unclassified Campylobacter TaxID=2593542 RepID=UPI001237FC8C|nr:MULTISPECIES: NADH-quinone oxidoreductase subunit J [unclassified Campylobacter]KAA6227270.1 NADH-quinone oxidoreductase subunit J [Campylobacter sp. LR286c]KAA6227857.1 NADH-quinone oxidoreductase subunit J [Campylobacter sp. LR185c]KAA6228265.1 NADH-quinone oxidoreductase subunit J [Campylobacter sp. LR196d]KAA6229265.1 NADH-quinone oxidoreductase subunit J [Campylobacter sp. LR291e]KAA6231071.1 NADH-quinone oxidoreductase subunit J [Campylobacter sp. LR264d]